ncbi:MAG: hypothetical protein M1457_14435 [bacterium]|nr:hypothetical protein [bacterium]
MGHRGQYRGDDYLPSTTRAVAWGAFFFALLACVVSFVTLFLTWRDGRLVRNFNLLVRGVRENIAAVRADGAAAEAAPEAQTAPAEIETEAMGERLGRIEKLIQDGNTQARFQLDNLMDELRPLRDRVSRSGAAWVEKTIQTLQTARDQITENGPAAAERIRQLAATLKRRPAETPQADDSGAPASVPSRSGGEAPAESPTEDRP